jgi:hypothetical protein
MEEHEGKRHKPKPNHPWKRSIGKTEIHKWAYEQSKISELAIKQPVKFQPK